MKLSSLSGSKMSLALYEYLVNKITEVPVAPGARNLKSNPDTIIFCNDPVEVKDFQALGKTWARIEIVNRNRTRESNISTRPMTPTET